MLKFNCLQMARQLGSPDTISAKKGEFLSETPTHPMLSSFLVRDSDAVKY